MADTETKVPGLAQRRGVPYWIAPRKAVLRGFTPKTVRLADGLTAEQIAHSCRAWQDEAREFLNGPRAAAFDGTFGSLCRLYQTHKRSSFRAVKWLTRISYARQLRVLEETVGGRLLAALHGDDFEAWYWGDAERGIAGFRAPATEGGPERATQAHHLMTMVRMVIAFGVVREIPHCARLAAILGKMVFPRGAAHKAAVTVEQVRDFIAAAHARGRASMALAFALQFETGLRQRDVIGEMTPDAAARPGPLSGRGKRWTTGLVWGEHIDPVTLLLAKPTSKSGGRKVAQADLRLCPLALAELDRIPPARRIGPVVISETTGQPYDGEAFRKLWRRIADAAGIPAAVWNMHARHGAENEAKLAGAHPLHIRNMMTHSDLKTTLGYDQASMDEARKVAELRRKHRGG